MSIAPNNLKNKRKYELKEIATGLGLNTKGFRDELEDRIREHLESSGNIKVEEEKSDATSSKTTPRRSFRGKSISNSKSRKESISSPPNGDRLSSDEENPSISSEGESKQAVERTEESTYADGNQLTSESSQRDILNMSHTTSDLESSRIFRDNVHDFFLRLRKNISNSKTFCKAVIYLELAVFLYLSFDWKEDKVGSIPFPSLSSKGGYIYYDIYLPDFLTLMKWARFWRPLISFIFHLLLLPLGFSYIFNFEPQRHLYSPLTFSVAQYAIFSISPFDLTDDVREFIPDSLIYTGAGAGAIFALYERILSINI